MPRASQMGISGCSLAHLKLRLGFEMFHLYGIPSSSMTPQASFFPTWWLHCGTSFPCNTFHMYPVKLAYSMVNFAPSLSTLSGLLEFLFTNTFQVLPSWPPDLAIIKGRKMHPKMRGHTCRISASQTHRGFSGPQMAS